MPSTINASNSGSGGLISTGDASGVLALQTAGTTAITVDTSQNVGIGTSSPAAKFNVKVASGATTYLDSNTSRVIVGDVSGVPYIQGLAQSGSNTGLAFYNGNAEVMRYDSSGNLLVGQTTNPNLAKVGITYTNGVTNGIILTTNGTAASNAVSFYNANGNIGNIVINGSATAYNTSSDYRLKNTITPITSALDKVALLKPVTYKWNVDGSDGQGFIAHELAEVVPDCVNGEKDAVDADGNPVYQGIDVSFLVATLTAAIQELKAINDTQAEELSRQAATINAQSAALAALTARMVALEGK